MVILSLHLGIKLLFSLTHSTYVYKYKKPMSSEDILFNEPLSVLMSIVYASLFRQHIHNEYI